MPKLPAFCHDAMGGERSEPRHKRCHKWHTLVQHHLVGATSKASNTPEGAIPRGPADEPGRTQRSNIWDNSAGVEANNKLECNATMMLGLKALQPCYCTDTPARQSRHQQSAVFAARESCSLVNAARVHIVRLGIHNWLHSVKVRRIFWGGRCRWGPPAVGLCDVFFAPFSQQAAPHIPELHG